MIKTFKKALAIMMTFIFVMSLVPAGVMAEEDNSSVILNFGNIAHSRGKDSANKHQNLAASGTAIRANGGSGNSSRYGYVQFDFSGYEEILQNEGTTLELHVTLGQEHTDARDGKDFELYAFDDSTDGYDESTITYNSAAEMGLHTFDQGKLIFAKSDGAVYETATPISGAVNKENVISMLETGMANSILTAVVKSTGSGDNWIYPIGKEKGIKICYSDAEIDNDDYVNKLANELTWDIISSEEQDKVTSLLDLPKKFYGADVIWTSTNEDAINPSSGEVVVDHQVSTYVTLTANLKYTNFNGDSAIASKSFDVKIPKDIIVLDGVNTGNNTITQGGSSDRKYIEQVIESDGLGGKVNGEDKYIKVTDFSGNPYLNAGGKYIFEISFLLTEECDENGLQWQCRLNDGTGSGTSSASTFIIKRSGVYVGDNKITDMPLNQWVNFAMVAPEGGIEGTEILSDGEVIGHGEYDKSFEFYINGELVLTDILDSATGGMYANRFFGYSTSESAPSAYIDNVRGLDKGIEYNAAYDKEANINFEGIDKLGKTITVTDISTTVADIKDGIGKSDDYEVRIYDESGVLLSDNNVLADDYTVVVAATNGTNMERAYSYYTIRVVNDGEFETDVPTITLTKDGENVEGSIKIYNYSGKDETYRVFLAVYEDGELVAVNTTSETLIAPTGQPTDFTTTFKAPFENGQSAKFFIWEANEITPAFKVTVFE